MKIEKKQGNVAIRAFEARRTKNLETGARQEVIPERIALCVEVKE